MRSDNEIQDQLEEKTQYQQPQIIIMEKSHAQSDLEDFQNSEEQLPECKYLQTDEQQLWSQISTEDCSDMGDFMDSRHNGYLKLGQYYESKYLEYDSKWAKLQEMEEVETRGIGQFCVQVINYFDINRKEIKRKKKYYKDCHTIWLSEH